MKKIVATILTCFVIVTLAHAQKDNSKVDEKIYNKLSNLFTMDKFVKCIEECEHMIKNDNYARSPYPYLYMSMCYYAIYQDQESYDMKKYKDPLRKALGFMGRFKKKDKSGDISQENSDFLRELKNASLTECANLLEKNDVKNLPNLARDIAKNYDKDEGMLLMSGVYLYKSNVKTDGDRNVEMAMNMLKKKQAEGNAKFDYDQEEALAKGFIMYTDYLVDAKDAAKAKTVMQFAKDILPSNEKIAKQAEKIMK